MNKGYPAKRGLFDLPRSFGKRKRSLPLLEGRSKRPLLAGQNKGPAGPLNQWGVQGHAPPENFEIWKLFKTIFSILGTKLSSKHLWKLQCLHGHPMYNKCKKKTFFNCNLRYWANDFADKMLGVYLYQKESISIHLSLFFTCEPMYSNSSRDKNTLGLFADLPDRQLRDCDKINQLQLTTQTLNQMRVKKIVIKR